MRNRGVILLLLLIIGIVVLPSAAKAIPITRADFGPSATVIDFNLDPGTVVTNQYSGQGVVFSPERVTTASGDGAVLSIDDGVVTALFDVTVHAVGMEYASSTPLTLELYDASDTPLDTYTFAAGNGFLGLSVTTPVKKAIIHDSAFAFNIDDFTFENPVRVPEPATLLLLGSGLFGLGLWRRWWRRKD